MSNYRITKESYESKVMHESATTLVVPVINALTPMVSLEERANRECHINADNDLAAVNVWLDKHKDSTKTHAAYKKEAERLLLWCVYIRGLTLTQLKVEDFAAYFDFLKKPPKDWCITRKELRSGKGSHKWRPFLGPLNQAGFNLAVRSLNSMMNFLVTANYLKFNPIKLTNKSKNFTQTLEEQKYNVWSRMLEEDEWLAVQRALESLPESNDRQVGNKIRTQFLFAMLYFLGLRIHELASHTWNAFRYLESRWCFFVKGKGGKLAHIPVHDQLLSFVKIYRIHLGKNPLPEVDDTDGLLISKYSKKPLGIRLIFSLVKNVGKIAAQYFDGSPIKQQKLLRLSPHWLRHLLASHLDKAAVPAIMIQSILRHSSLDITNIYMHAEELLKHQEIQKLAMRVSPKLQQVDSENSSIALTVSLTKGSVCNELSLLKLLDTIEQVIFKNRIWEAQDKDREQLLIRYQKLYRYKQPLVFSYTLFNVREEELDFIRLAIINEAGIRLFGCEIIMSVTEKAP